MSVPYKFILRTFLIQAPPKFIGRTVSIRKRKMHYWKVDYHTHLPFTGSDSLTYVQQCIIFRKRETDRQTENTQTDRHTDRHTRTQTDRQTDRQTERERERNDYQQSK
jgi:hypothetical protein